MSHIEKALLGTASTTCISEPDLPTMVYIRPTSCAQSSAVVFFIDDFEQDHNNLSQFAAYEAGDFQTFAVKKPRQADSSPALRKNARHFFTSVSFTRSFHHSFYIGFGFSVSPWSLRSASSSSMSLNMADAVFKSEKKRWLTRLLPKHTAFLKRRSKTPTTLSYDPLPGLDFLRVLDILPGSGEDEIRCRLRIKSMARAEDAYEAISYVWGDPTIQATILVDDCPMDVTVNLADALRSFRHREKTRRVWADAICINQNDDIEKNHQVKEMGKIYASAYRVLVWLGRDDEGIAED